MIKKYFKSLLNSCVAGAILLNITLPSLLGNVWQDFVNKTLPISLAGTVNPIKLNVIATGYSSTADQTDSTPFHTATGEKVFDGLIAANFLKFGTQVKIPALFSDKIFTVKDRMNRRFTHRYPHRIDIWFADKKEAKKFGLQNVEILVLGGIK